jgi:hypothetical protein
MCSYCGVQWRRSQLHRDRSENLACPDCAPGLDVVSLSEGNAELMRSQQPKEIGPVDGGFDSFISPPSPGFKDPGGFVMPQPTNQGPTGPLSKTVEVWLRSDLLQLVAGRVNVWPDQSGRQHSLIATSVATRPSVTASDPAINGLTAVWSDGVDDFIFCPSLIAKAPLWVWVISKYDDFAINTVMVSAGASLMKGSAGTQQVLSTNITGPANGGALIAAWSRAMFAFNVSGTDTLQIKSVLTTQPSSSSITGRVSLFARSDGSAPTRGAFAELIVVQGMPTPAEIAGIEAYGIARYGGGLFA